MADNETIKDIRKDAEAKFRELVEAWMQRRSTFQTTVGAMQAFNTLFDRLEAAHRRERGDAAKLREALMYAEKVLDTAARNVRGETGMVVDSDYAEAARKCRAALAAPARNCDIAQDWLHDLYVNFKPPASVRREMPPEWVDAVMAFCRWLIAPAPEKEGGDDGK